MITVVAAVIERAQKILVCQRRQSGAHPLKWEFPGGKVEPGEEFSTALARELNEELGIAAKIGDEMARYEYAYPGKSTVLLIFFAVNQFAGDPENRIFEQIEWTCRSKLLSYDFLEGDIDFVRRITELPSDPRER